MKYSLHHWYVIQTFVNKEKDTIQRIEKLNLDGLMTLLPLRKLCIKRKGEFHWELKPLFSGYIFINKRLRPEDLKVISKIHQVIKILRNNKNPVMVPEKDMKLIFQMMNEHHHITESEAFVIEDKVKIMAGPLKNMEGFITNVDKHRKRITVRLPFFNTYKDVQFSFELINKV